MVCSLDRLPGMRRRSHQRVPADIRARPLEAQDVLRGHVVHVAQRALEHDHGLARGRDGRRDVRERELRLAHVHPFVADDGRLRRRVRIELRADRIEGEAAELTLRQRVADRTERGEEDLQVVDLQRHVLTERVFALQCGVADLRVEGDAEELNVLREGREVAAGGAEQIDGVRACHRRGVRTGRRSGRDAGRDVVGNAGTRGGGTRRDRTREIARIRCEILRRSRRR